MNILGVGVAGSGLEFPDGAPQCSAFRFPSAWSEFESSVNLGLVSRALRRWVVALPMPNHACEVDWVGGASMIIRREVFEDIGVLDQGYYTHYEDVDFCFNARKAGWAVWYVPDSRVTHLVGQSTGLTVTNPKRRFPPYFFGARRRYFSEELWTDPCGTGRCRPDMRTRVMASASTVWQARLDCAASPLRYHQAQCVRNRVQAEEREKPGALLVVKLCLIIFPNPPTFWLTPQSNTQQRNL